jgi:hypothetical protein
MWPFCRRPITAAACAAIFSTCPCWICGNRFGKGPGAARRRPVPHGRRQPSRPDRPHQRTQSPRSSIPSTCSFPPPASAPVLKAAGGEPADAETLGLVGRPDGPAALPTTCGDDFPPNITQIWIFLKMPSHRRCLCPGQGQGRRSHAIHALIIEGLLPEPVDNRSWTCLSRPPLRPIPWWSPSMKPGGERCPTVFSPTLPAASVDTKSRIPHSTTGTGCPCHCGIRDFRFPAEQQEL